MRLTHVLFGVFKKKGITGQKFRFERRIPGSLYAGKVRIVPDLKKGHKLRMWKELAIEEENIAYISKPYLTTAEEKHLPTEYIEKGVKTTEKYEKIRSKPLRSVYLAEILEHINVDDLYCRLPKTAMKETRWVVSKIKLKGKSFCSVQ